MSKYNNKLCIEELKKYFNENKVITVNDFNRFYTEIYGNINKNTVAWNIYELKKLEVIRNISRGQYVFIDKVDNVDNEYVVITMDIIGSSKWDAIKFEEAMLSRIDFLNKVLYEQYEVNRKFKKAIGDEIQILLPFDERLGAIMVLALSYLRPFKLRYGISIGELSGELKENSWEMNEAIFWNARDLLDKLKKEKKYAGLIMSSYRKTDEICNELMPIINLLLNGVSDKQWEVVNLELSKTPLEDGLNILDISKSSYYERLKVSNLEEILSGFDTIYKILKLRKEIK